MPHVNCKREGCTRRTNKVERGFCSVHWRTEKKPLDDRRAYDKCQVCDANCAKGASHCHLHNGSREQAQAVRYQKVKNDPELLAARRLQQVLACYKRDFPNDPDPPTTQTEVTERRKRHRLSEAVAQYISDFPEDTLAPHIVKWTWTLMCDRKRLLQFRRAIAEYVREHPDEHPPKTNTELRIRRANHHLAQCLADYARKHPDDPSPPKTLEQLRFKEDLARYVSSYPDDPSPPTTQRELDEKRAELFRLNDTSCDHFFCTFGCSRR